MNTTSGYSYGTNGSSTHQSDGMDGIAQIANLATKEVLAEQGITRNATPIHHSSTRASMHSGRSDTSQESIDNRYLSPSSLYENKRNNFKILFFPYCF